MDTRKLTNAAMMAALAVVLSLLGAYFPPLFLLFFLIPAPIAIACIRGSESYAIVASFIVFTADVIFIDLGTAFTALFFALQGFLMGYLISKKRKASEVLLDVTALSIVGMVGIFYLLKLAFNIDIMAHFFKAIDAAVANISSFYKSHPNFSMIQANLLSMKQILEMTIPASLIIAVLFMVWLNYLLVYRILKTQHFNIEPLPPFEEWKMPYITGWIFIGALLYQYFTKEPNLIITNIVVLLSFGFTIGGLALIKFYLTRKLNMNSLGANLLLVFLLFFPLTSWLLAVVGIADTSLDLRKYLR
ncbi:DUF2232 domain-containing protein [Caldanaerobacter subterraneus]|uniref:YybS family protein n=1 Tax=Caldanaerobacter subterraneus TaxID=911092 RepID=A0A7Y2L7E6_9THEO|nr:YybS family protein [Caldanaerobacter subterraneus]NNG67167.1 YybS family protein [Caldanaerobacter subterraneus]